MAEHEETKAETFWQNLQSKADSIEEVKEALDEGGPDIPLEKW
jgi:hypothetical protein